MLTTLLSPLDVLLISGSSGLLIAWATYWCLRQPSVFVFIYLGAILVETSPMLFDRSVSVGGFEFGPGDAVLVPIAGATLIRFTSMVGGSMDGQRARQRVYAHADTGILLLLVLSLLGAVISASSTLHSYGPGTWLPWIEGTLLALFTISFWPQLAPHFFGILVSVGLIGATVAIVSILLVGLGSATDGLINVGGELVPARPLTAPSALVVLFAAVAAATAQRASLWKWALLLVYLSTVAVSQNRSVWASGLGALAVTSPWWLPSSVGKKAATLAVSATGLAAVMAFALPGLMGGRLGTAFEASATSSTTWDWRVTRWQEYVALDRGTSQIAVGALSGETDAVDGTLFHVEAHNFLLEAFNLLGVVGLAMIAWLLVAALGAGFSLASQDARPLAMITALVLYGVAYNWPPAAWIVLAACLCMTSTPPSRPGDVAVELRNPEGASSGAVSQDCERVMESNMRP